MNLPAKPPINEDEMQRALIESRGDIFIASQTLGITALRLDRAIRVSATLQATVDQIRESKRGAGMSEDALREAVNQRVALYRVVGLDALHDLAAMPIDANSAQNQVKLAAAARLVGGLEGSGGGGDLADTLRELRDSYNQHAPRLRVIRERTTTTVEIGPPDERVISEQPGDD